MAARELPSQFADLQVWVDDWALTGEYNRHQRLLASSIEQVRAFYDAVFPRLPSIIAYVDQFELDSMPTDAQCLFDLTMTFVEVSHTVELKWKQTDIRDSVHGEKIRYLGPSQTI